MTKPYPMNPLLLNGNGDPSQICCMLDGLEKIHYTLSNFKTAKKIICKIIDLLPLTEHSLANSPISISLDSS